MKRGAKESWTLPELAEETGLSARTIRYYIARGLLEGPAVAGRGATYTPGHLARLRAIQELQSRGAMLAEIGRLLAGARPHAALPQPATWHQYALEEDVVVWVRADAASWRRRQLSRALADFASRIKPEENHADNDGKS